MSKPLRLLSYAILGPLWASGCLWLVLDRYAARSGPFGSEPHPLAAPVLLAHGVLALAATYLLGWVSARHAARWWPRRARRISGAAFAAVLAALGLSGFALFFLTEEHWQRLAALTHDALGLAVTALGVQHGCPASPRDMRSAVSRPW